MNVVAHPRAVLGVMRSNELEFKYIAAVRLSDDSRFAPQLCHVLPNGWRVNGERRAEGDERVRCTGMLGRWL